MDKSEQLTERTYFRIEVAAQRAGVSPARIRRLESAGLIRPVRVVGRSRLYSEHEVARIRKIRRLTENLGVNLAGAAVVLRLVAEIEALRAELDRRREPHSPEPRL